MKTRFSAPSVAWTEQAVLLEQKLSETVSMANIGGGIWGGFYPIKKTWKFAQWILPKFQFVLNVGRMRRFEARKSTICDETESLYIRSIFRSYPSGAQMGQFRPLDSFWFFNWFLANNKKNQVVQTGPFVPQPVDSYKTRIYPIL